MITIVHILGDANLSGAPRHVLTLASHLDGGRFSSQIICPSGPIVAALRAENLTVTELPMSSKFAFGTVARLRQELQQIIAQVGPNIIIHCHGVRAGWFGRLAAKGLNKPVIYTEHSWTADYHLPSKVNDFTQRQMLRFLDRYTTKTIGVSQAVVDFLTTTGITSPDKIVRIYNGLELPKSAIKPADQPVIGSVGSLSWQKNYDWLIAVLSEIRQQVSEARLEIVGAGPDEAKLRQQIKDLDLDSAVTLLGSLPAEQLSDRYKQWMLYVQPSLAESFGLAMAEAAAAGLSVLSSKVGSAREVLGTDEALFELNQPQQAAQQIVTLLTDQKQRQALAQAERAHVQQFTVKAMVQGHEKLYSDLMK